jgi:hypothetical protein
MQIPTNINLSNLIAAQSAGKTPKPPATPTFPAETAPVEPSVFEPLVLKKADAPAKPAGQKPPSASGPIRLGGQIDIKI